MVDHVHCDTQLYATSRNPLTALHIGEAPEWGTHRLAESSNCRLRRPACCARAGSQPVSSRAHGSALHYSPECASCCYASMMHCLSGAAQLAPAVCCCWPADETMIRPVLPCCTRTSGRSLNISSPALMAWVAKIPLPRSSPAPKRTSTGQSKRSTSCSSRTRNAGVSSSAACLLLAAAGCLSWVHAWPDLLIVLSSLFSVWLPWHSGCQWACLLRVPQDRRTHHQCPLLVTMAGSHCQT